jgi:pimeloyl-ACP methyl ester carboxylesterase
VTGFFWFLLGLTGLTLTLHLVARLLYVSVGARMFGQVPWLPSQWREPLCEGETVRLAAADGTRLEGTYLPCIASRRQGTVACCHELNGDRWNAIPFIQGLRRRGFDVFSFDFRNHGASDRTPGYEPTPWVTTYETADVRAVIDYLASRPDACGEGIGLFGLSKGGTAALAAAADDPRVCAVVVEGLCPTERLQVHWTRELLTDHGPLIARLLGLTDLLVRPLGAWARLVVGWRRHCRFVNVEQAARQATSSVLLIHGGGDSHVPVELVCELKQAMPPQTTLWIVPWAKHAGAVEIAGEEYHERIARFFLDHLASKTARSDATAPAAVRRVETPVECPSAKPLEEVPAF